VSVRAGARTAMHHPVAVIASAAAKRTALQRLCCGTGCHHWAALPMSLPPCRHTSLGKRAPWAN